ncbi:MAG: type II toxin-antitoxin system HicB family antitoxin [Acidimicrobiales bacterium]
MTNTQVTNYHGTFELDESGNWIAQVSEIPQVHTFGRTLGKAREYLVDALALWLNVPIDTIKGSIDFQPVTLPANVQNIVYEANAARAMADAANEAVSGMMSAAALALTEDARLSLRDAAELLGVSHQRVQQLVAHGKAENIPAVGSGIQGVAQDIARNLKEFLPGGSKENLGALAFGVTIGFTIAWAQAQE